MRDQAMWAALSLMITGFSASVLFLTHWVGRLDRAVERYRKASLQATEALVDAVQAARATVMVDIARLEMLPPSTMNRDEHLEQARGLLQVLNRLSPPPPDPSTRN